jgi:protein SCO1/2
MPLVLKEDPRIKHCKPKLIFLIVFSVISIFYSGCGEKESPFHGNAYSEPITAPDFILTNTQGDLFKLSDYRGHVILIFFGYIYCPDVCPMTLSAWAKVQAGLRNESDKVKFVFITVDPDRDTPAQLHKHLSIFSDNFIGLTGELEELNPVYDSYGVLRKIEQISDSSTGYVVSHTSWIYVVDRSGILRLNYLFDAQPDDILHDVKLILKN